MFLEVKGREGKLLEGIALQASRSLKYCPYAMARKKSEVARVAIGYTVLPMTKEALGRLAVGGVSAGEIIDRAVAQYKRDGGGLSLTFDVGRLLEWMDEPKRAPAGQVFTVGDERAVAYRYELAVLAKAGTAWDTSPYAETRMKQLCAEWNLSQKDVLDLVLETFSAKTGDASEPVTIIPDVAHGLQPRPGEVPCHCDHCGKDFTAARRGNLCGVCAEKGHAGDQRDCPGCGLGMSI